MNGGPLSYSVLYYLFLYSSAKFLLVSAAPKFLQPMECPSDNCRCRRAQEDRRCHSQPLQHLAPAAIGATEDIPQKKTLQFTKRPKIGEALGP